MTNSGRFLPEPPASPRLDSSSAGPWLQELLLFALLPQQYFSETQKDIFSAQDCRNDS